MIVGGRVIDPLHGIDAILNVHVSKGKIACIAEPDMSGAGTRDSDQVIIDATGLVVAPGFIDIHAHEGDIEFTMEAMARDGVTTMIGGNCGASEYPLADFFRKLETDGCLINYSSYAGATTLRELAGAVNAGAPATSEQVARAVALAAEEMQAGALGVSFGIQYAHGMRYDEILALGRVAAEYGGLTAAHARDAGADIPALEALDEMIRLAGDTSAPHQFSHIGSMLAYGMNMAPALEKIRRARTGGIVISADVYAYNASLAAMNSETIAGDVFSKYQCQPGDFEVITDFCIDGEPYMHSGECFTSKEQFYHVREMTLAGRTDVIPIILAHLQNTDQIKLAMQSPYVAICTDGAVYKNPETGSLMGHPRVAGGFARWFGLWVRDRAAVELNTAIFKSSTMAKLTLGLQGKGTVSAGADADLVIFNPATIRDTAGYGQDDFLNAPTGIAYVIVNGIVVADHGTLVPGVNPGRPIRRIWNVPGYLGFPPQDPATGPIIKANGAGGNIEIGAGDLLTVNVQLYPGFYSGIPADWWLVANAGTAWFQLNSNMQWNEFDGNPAFCQPVLQCPLFNLPDTEVLRLSALPSGMYSFYFGVDYPMDGIFNLDGPFLYDRVDVIIRQKGEKAKRTAKRVGPVF